MRKDRLREYVPWGIFFRGFLHTRPRCTRCGDDRVIPSRTQFGFPASFLGISAYRCRACTMKFALRLSLPDYYDLKSQMPHHVSRLSPSTPEEPELEPESEPEPPGSGPDASEARRRWRSRSNARPAELGVGLLLKGLVAFRATCTRCGAADLSRSREVLGAIPRAIGLRPFRCHKCGRRCALGPLAGSSRVAAGDA